MWFLFELRFNITLLIIMIVHSGILNFKSSSKSDIRDGKVIGLVGGYAMYCVGSGITTHATN